MIIKFSLVNLCMGTIKHYNLKETDIFIFDDYIINQIHDVVLLNHPLVKIKSLKSTSA